MGPDSPIESAWLGNIEICCVADAPNVANALGGEEFDVRAISFCALRLSAGAFLPALAAVVPAQGELKALHDRKPIIISPEMASQWIDALAHRSVEVLAQARSPRLLWHKVGTAVGNAQSGVTFPLKTCPLVQGGSGIGPTPMASHVLKILAAHHEIG